MNQLGSCLSIPRQEEMHHKTVQESGSPSLRQGLLWDPMPQALCLALIPDSPGLERFGKGPEIGLKASEKRAKLKSHFISGIAAPQSSYPGTFSPPLRPYLIPTGIIFCQEKPSNLLARVCGHKAG